MAVPKRAENQGDFSSLDGSPDLTDCAEEIKWIAQVFDRPYTCFNAEVPNLADVWTFSQEEDEGIKSLLIKQPDEVMEECFSSASFTDRKQE